MNDSALVAKKTAFIETCLADLRRLANPAALETDIRGGDTERAPRR